MTSDDEITQTDLPAIPEATRDADSEHLPPPPLGTQGLTPPPFEAPTEIPPTPDVLATQTTPDQNPPPHFADPAATGTEALAPEITSTSDFTSSTEEAPAETVSRAPASPPSLEDSLGDGPAALSKRSFDFGWAKQILAPVTAFRERFRFPIAFKLVTITITLLFSITALIAIRSSEQFTAKFRDTTEISNRTQAENRATEIEGLLQSYLEKTKIVASLMYRNTVNEADREESLNLTFRNDKDFVSVEIFEVQDGIPRSVKRIVNLDYLKSYDLSEDYLSTVRKSKPFPLNAVFAGQVEIINSSLPKGAPLITLGLPFVKDSFERVSHVAIADFRLDRIQKTFAAVGASEIFLVDRNGVVLAHPEDQLALQAVSMKENPIVQKAIEAKERSNHIPSFVNPATKEQYYGVFNKTPFGVAVIAQIPEEVILEPAKLAQRTAFYVGALVLSGALFLVFLFSVSLTSPLEKLLEITGEIARGNFEVHAGKQIATADEVGDLAKAFDHMTSGLKALVKTQGADVAKALMETDLDNLGGTKKNVAVLFSDLRGFTKFSEGCTPEEVVEMLNEYFEVMVGCVERNKGRVNKFIGDAIMAMWGAPTSTGQDEALAAMAALEMRIELNKLNDLRLSRGQPPIMIGIGLHCGEAVAGTIGSKSRLEYTIIGDTVNQASRLEASTKAFGTDIIISEEMMNKVKDYFVVDYAGAAEVKGKSEPLKMFKIKGYVDEDGAQQIVQTPYSEYQAEAADKVKVAA